MYVSSKTSKLVVFVNFQGSQLSATLGVKNWVLFRVGKTNLDIFWGKIFVWSQRSGTFLGQNGGFISEFLKTNVGLWFSAKFWNCGMAGIREVLDRHVVVKIFLICC